MRILTDESTGEKFEIHPAPHGKQYVELVEVNPLRLRARLAETEGQAAPVAPAVPEATVGPLLQAVRNVMEGAYNRVSSVCCQRPGGYECCGNPEPEWGQDDEGIMNDLAPVEKFLASLIAAPKEGGK